MQNNMTEIAENPSKDTYYSNDLQKWGAEIKNKDISLKELVFNETGEKVSLCYQCGKCTAGCPLSDEMDIAPNTILRLLQIGSKEYDRKVLSSYTIWVCLSCETCMARCPKEVDLPAITDFLRSESIRRHLANRKANNIINFHKAFLHSIRGSGRLYEFGLVIGYKLRAKNLFQDVLLAPSMITHGKLKFIPAKVKNSSQIKEIFQKTINNNRGGK